MKTISTFFMAFFFALAAMAQTYRTPESFLAKIPAYPTTSKNVQVILDTLGNQEKAIQAAQKDYSDAIKKAQSGMDQAAMEKADKRQNEGLDSNKMKEMHKKQQEDMQSLTDTSKEGVAKKMKNFDKEFSSNQSKYNAEMRKTIVPLDSAINAEMSKTTGGSVTDAISTMITKRTTAYQDIMNRYLIGEKASFPLFFATYLAYLKGTVIPLLDKMEVDQTKIFSLSFVPHANALGAIEGYMTRYKIAIQNLKDYKEWIK